MAAPSPSRFDFLHGELDDRSSPAASTDGFQASTRPSPAIDFPSQHSGFRSGEESEPESDSVGPWSPPAWRRPGNGWFQHDRLAPSQSRESSPRYPDGDTTLPANVPLPQSPEKRTPSPSPQPAVSTGIENPDEPKGDGTSAVESDGQVKTGEEPGSDTLNNYFRFAVRAEVQHRTDNIDAAIIFLRYQYRRITSSKTSIMTFASFFFLAILMLRSLFKPQEFGPGPDLIKAAGVAKNFERLIYYSESGAVQVGELQETGVAVWDLGESVRSSNMTSAPIIVRELDNLSDSLKTLAIELTRFFANVNGDVDSILIVMEWAKRELAQVSGQMPSALHSAYDNALMYAHKVGGEKFGSYVTELFGLTHNQMSKATLQRTFTEFLNVLEDSINSELTYTTTLFGLFEAIDRQFLNLQRTVVRELDSQNASETRKEAELAELWRRLIGSNAGRVKKYQKNKHLLENIKRRTVMNKLTLTDHNHKLLDLKSQLEDIRKRLVSPLVRSNASSTLSIEEQMNGLDGVYEYLRGVREDQKSKLVARLYGGSSAGSGSGASRYLALGQHEANNNNDQ